MSHYFKDGQKVDRIVWPNEDTIRAGHGADSLEISMEPGHMSMVPFVKINYYGGEVGMIDAHSVLVIFPATQEDE